MVVPHGRFNVLVVTQAQADAQDAAQDDADQAGAGAADDELRLVSPSARGFVVFRALASREGDYDAAAAARGRLPMFGRKAGALTRRPLHDLRRASCAALAARRRALRIARSSGPPASSS